MRGALARLLVAIFGFLPISPALFAIAPAPLPACCAHGAHQCARHLGALPPSSETTIRAGSCPMFPGAQGITAHTFDGTPAMSGAAFSQAETHPASHSQAEAFYRISQSRAAQKRGPPALLS